MSAMRVDQLKPGDQYQWCDLTITVHAVSRGRWRRRRKVRVVESCGEPGFDTPVVHYYDHDMQVRTG